MNEEVISDLVLEDWYFESSKNLYWLAKEGKYHVFNENNVLRRLERDGFSTKKSKKGGMLSPATKALLKIQDSNSVGFVGSLAGYRHGPKVINGQPALITRGPTMIEPVHGDWPTIQELVETLFVDEEHNQLDRFLLWMRESATDLYEEQLSSHLNLVLVGPVDCGKSQLKERIIVPSLGGRQGFPFSFMQGATPFNEDLFDAEILIVDDETSASDWRSRESLKAKMKILSATSHHRHHSKFGKAQVLPTYWRLVLICNEEGNNLAVLPSLDASIKDKILMLRCRRATIFEGVHDTRAKHELSARIRNELPGFLHWLLNDYKPAAEIPRGRFGVSAWQHPLPTEHLHDLSSESEYDGVLQDVLFSDPSNSSWSGLQADLRRKIYKDPIATKLLDDVVGRGANSCAALLNNLAGKFPDRYAKKRGRWGYVWTISARRND